MTEEEWKQFKDDVNKLYANNFERDCDISSNKEELDAIHDHVSMEFQEMVRGWLAIEDSCEVEEFIRGEERFPRFSCDLALHMLLAICAKRMMLGGNSADHIREWLEHSQKHW